MGVLRTLELQGQTGELMAASEELDRRLPAPDGLRARIVASTVDGIVLFQLWDSAAAPQGNADDPAHADALAASGMLVVPPAVAPVSLTTREVTPGATPRAQSSLSGRRKRSRTSAGNRSRAGPRV